MPQAGGPRILLQCGRTEGDKPGLLTDRRLRYLLGGLVASGAADGFGPVTLSFAVLRVTGSVSRLGLVLAAQATTALALTLAGGLAADRFPRARILICSLAGRATAAALLAVALLTGTASFPLLLAAAAGYGCADGFFGAASTALVPDLVPRERLAPANALLGGTTSTAAIAAPALAGLVVAAFGPGAGFAVQAALLTAAAGSLWAGVARVAKVTRVVGRERGALMPVMTAEALALGLGAPLAVVAAAAVVTGLAMGVQTVFFATAMQASVRAEVLARVAAIDLLGSEGGQPIGYALAGPAAVAIGAHAFLTGSAVIMAAAGAVFAFLPALRASPPEAAE